jgi:biopolymer transport protein ExbB
MHGLIAGFEFILRGGFMMYPLLLSALIALTVIFERLFAFQKQYQTSSEFVGQVLERVQSGKMHEAIGLCRALPTPVSSVLSAGIEHFQNPSAEMELAMTGMMASFRVLSEKGVNEPNAITGGVAEALIATATGLVIALVCLVAYNYLSSKIKVFIYQVESAASRLIEARMAKERKA